MCVRACMRARTCAHLLEEHVDELALDVEGVHEGDGLQGALDGLVALLHGGAGALLGADAGGLGVGGGRRLVGPGAL